MMERKRKMGERKKGKSREKKRKKKKRERLLIEVKTLKTILNRKENKNKC